MYNETRSENRSYNAHAQLPTDFDLTKVTPLDSAIYDADVDFLSTLTGIKDPEELKQHILKVQADAYAVFPYPCIRNFAISKTKINHYPAYQDLLKLGKERKGAIFLELACCVGNDIRRAVLDGFPASQAVGTDLNAGKQTGFYPAFILKQRLTPFRVVSKGFWDVGHMLFKSTSETFPVKFIAGDILQPSFFDPQAKVEDSPPDLTTLASLTPLVGHVSAIHASSFFHLFDEEHQLKLAHLVNALLSPEPGSIAFGAHGGLPEKGLRVGSLKFGETSKPMTR
ncbi:hypothetical protein BDY19DRAFT_1056370 [Irpex rosettiformis]|uniref:Uncharacterized protein n=1 Tax=Irpex rosettiformis TaxID=378272 RepID=A0ACB8U6J8_9APHY|nr:hypothetical protein BDY19DRAFT_1056370 [Irpex rosettiformis]